MKYFFEVMTKILPLKSFVAHPIYSKRHLWKVEDISSCQVEQVSKCDPTFLIQIEYMRCQGTLILWTKRNSTF